MMTRQVETVNIIYINLMINYCAYGNYDFITCFTTASIYMSTYIYAQTILYPSESVSYTLTLNIPHALTAALSMIIV